MAPSRVRIPPSPLAQRPPRFCAHPRRGGRAVECCGLENRYPSLGGSRVQIPPPPLHQAESRTGPRLLGVPARAADPFPGWQRKTGGGVFWLSFRCVFLSSTTTSVSRLR